MDKSNLSKIINKLKKDKLTFILVILATLIASFFAVGYAVGTSIRPLYALFDKTANDKSVLYYGFVNKVGLYLTIGILVCGIIFIAYSLVKKSKSNTIDVDDDRGVSFMGKGTYGTSRWMKDNEIRQNFYVGDIRNTNATVYGQLTDDGKQVVCNKSRPKGSGDHQNVWILGSPGTGKSRGFVKTELIQSINRGESFIATDPSGELYHDIGQYCRDKGVNVRVLNLVDIEYSDFWNCLKETIDPKTGRLDGSRLNEFVNVYMRNAATGKDDSFWYDCATNLLKTAIGYAAFKRDSYILKEYTEIYNKLTSENGKTSNSAKNNKMFDIETASFVAIENKLLTLADEKCYYVEYIKELIYDIKKVAPAFNLSEVFNILMNFKTVEEKTANFSAMPNSHPGKIAYNIFATNSADKVRESALQGIQIKMQLLSDPKLLKMLSYDGIDISNINKEQTACFVIMNDKTTTLTPISSLFFSFFFKDAQENWDNTKNSLKPGEENPCYAVCVMLDEFFSIGVIGGDPANFAVVMSNSRKRELHINIITQSILQIDERYGKNNASTIETCVSTILFLGCNDKPTADFISQFASGDATVLAEGHRENNHRSLLRDSPDDINVSSGRRLLLTTDEVRRWKDQVLLVKRGELPAKLNLFYFDDHPLYKNGSVYPVPIYKTIAPLSDRIEPIDEESDINQNSKTKTNITNRIKNIYNFQTGSQMKLELDYDNLDNEDTINENDDARQEAPVRKIHLSSSDLQNVVYADESGLLVDQNTGEIIEIDKNAIPTEQTQTETKKTKRKKSTKGSEII